MSGTTTASPSSSRQSGRMTDESLPEWRHSTATRDREHPQLPDVLRPGEEKSFITEKIHGKSGCLGLVRTSDGAAFTFMAGSHGQRRKEVDARRPSFGADDLDIGAAASPGARASTAPSSAQPTAAAWRWPTYRPRRRQGLPGVRHRRGREVPRPPREGRGPRAGTTSRWSRRSPDRSPGDVAEEHTYGLDDADRLTRPVDSAAVLRDHSGRGAVPRRAGRLRPRISKSISADYLAVRKGVRTSIDERMQGRNPGRPNEFA